MAEQDAAERQTNPTYVANAAIVRPGSKVRKNNRLKTKAAAVPYGRVVPLDGGPDQAGGATRAVVDGGREPWGVIVPHHAAILNGEVNSGNLDMAEIDGKQIKFAVWK